ncbi:MAG: SpoIID/LytB domain-containing protein [bacterium]|nr:SpoIID/LytB domain-containing protein [bacterium]
MRKVWAVWFLILMIPYLVTLAWTGQVQGEVQEHPILSGRMVILAREDGNRILDAEDYLIGVMAAQIPPEYGSEALKAQAIIDRTYLYRIMDGRTEVEEEEFDLDYMDWNHMIQEWGQLMAAEYYQKFQEAVTSTAMTVMKYEGEWIDPLFHKVSAGRTRNGDTKLFPYLVGMTSPRDVEAENYLQIVTMSEAEFAKKINEIPDHAQIGAAGIFETVQIVKKDEAGYIESMQIGGNTYSGEEVQYALGLASACFSIKKEQNSQEEGNLRIVTKGVGHGYGLSQYGAKILADEGWKAEDILNYYYQNIVFISE